MAHIMKNIITEIEADIVDIKDKGFVFVKTKDVPNRHDSTFTFERGEDKKGKEICTCVLFVDIRNSVKLTQKHNSETMGRIYTIFSKSMLKLAKHHQGRVRNIIGDRVMVVFPEEDCFKNAIYCAISINHVAKSIRETFTDVDFRCGVGIDYGQLKVIKVGLHRQQNEGVDNKNLVWTGQPANIASRLTDNANKEVTTSYMEVKYYPNRSRSIRRIGLGLESLVSNPLGIEFPPASPYIMNEHTKNLSLSEFTDSITFVKDAPPRYTHGRLISFKKVNCSIKYDSVLITDAVFKGFKTSHPDSDIIKDFKEMSNHNIKDFNGSIYGTSVYWAIKKS